MNYWADIEITPQTLEALDSMGTPALIVLIVVIVLVAVFFIVRAIANMSKDEGVGQAVLIEALNNQSELFAKSNLAYLEHLQRQNEVLGSMAEGLRGLNRRVSETETENRRAFMAQQGCVSRVEQGIDRISELICGDESNPEQSSLQGSIEVIEQATRDIPNMLRENRETLERRVAALHTEQRVLRQQVEQLPGSGNAEILTELNAIFEKLEAMVDQRLVESEAATRQVISSELSSIHDSLKMAIDLITRLHPNETEGKKSNEQ